MGVDLLRSCYSTTMQLDPAGDVIVPVTWYRCAPGAKPLPFPTLFGSGNWASDRTNWFGPGEVLGGSHAYSKGKTPVGMVGKKWAGPREWFEHGQPSRIRRRLQLTTNSAGQCSRCLGQNWCQDFFRLPGTMSVEIVAVSAVFDFGIPPPVLPVYGYAGRTFALPQVLFPPAGMAWALVVDLPPPFIPGTQLSLNLDCVVDSWRLQIGQGNVVFYNSIQTSVDPLGIYFGAKLPIQFNYFGFTVLETWTMSLGVNLGPGTPSPGSGPFPGGFLPPPTL
jgi:hypothetical protein